MRILLTGKYVPSGPRKIGGLQSWIKTVRRELEALGHECVEWQPGMVEPIGRFNLGILANMSLTCDMASKCDETVCVSHGIIAPEAPGDADRVYFVSEGVREHWGRDGGILRQPIDLGFWQPPKRGRMGAIRYSYRNTATKCEAAAKYEGFKYRQVADASHEEAREWLSCASIVFATGRAALEAMACGAPTVIYDHRAAYQGPLLDWDLWRQMRNSYSGRGGVENPPVETIATEIRRCEAAPREFWRNWVETHHDARRIVKELIG